LNSKERGVCSDTQSAQPFLKWPGGKRWLWGTLESFLPVRFTRYYEPFLGGGAIFFALHPKRALLSDINPDLINTYVQVRDRLEDVTIGLHRLAVDRETYDRVRNSDPSDDVTRAVRFIYLSKTAFNGIYRVNQRGVFNVPFAGQFHRKVFDPLALKVASLSLQHCRLESRPFASSLTSAKQGDLVYCDPPYTTRHNNNRFLRYNESLFSWGDQKELAELAKAAVRRGVYVVVSNAGTDHLRTLYSGFKVITVRRPSCVSAQREFRRNVTEFLFIGGMNKVSRS
jgi:DNA adenine methylase